MGTHAIIQAQQEFISKYMHHCELAITLQTNLRTHNKSEKAIQHMEREAVKAMYKFRQRFNQQLTGNRWRRDAAYLPIIITALEGTLNTYDHNRSIHYHLAVGNFDPVRVDKDDFETKLRINWQASSIGTEDILIKRINPSSAQSWGVYMNKEAWKGNLGCIDYENTQIPVHLLGI